MTFTNNLRPLMGAGQTVLCLLFLSACNDDADNPPTTEQKPLAQVTWHQDIAPLVTEKCATCHNQDGIAPFSVETYDQVKAWAQLMEHQILEENMPPWGAQDTAECTPPRAFAGDLRLSDEQKILFSQWVADGAPEGDASTPVPLPEVVEDRLQNPNRQLTIASPAIIDGDHDKFICFRVEVDNQEKVWLTGSQIIPGNTAVAHHGLVFTDPNNESAALAGEDGSYECFGSPGVSNTSLVSVWAPGIAANRLPQQTGTPLAPQSTLVIQMHYHPTGTGAEVDDATRLDLEWQTEEPKYLGQTLLFGNFHRVDDPELGGDGFGLVTGPDFKIPAGAESHTEINKMRLPLSDDEQANQLPLSIWMVGTHMHYAGVDMKLTLNADNADEQCLVQTPDWDFNWQRIYYYEGDIPSLPTMRLGDTLTLRCTYNNSLTNDAVKHALQARGLAEPVDIHLGEETLDEMCVGALGLAVPAEHGELLGL